MKTLIIASAIAAAGLTGSVSAAELTTKATNSQGSNIGQASSSFTGNGAAIGGGTKGTGQTQEPGSRGDAVQALQAAEGRGRDK